MTDPTLMQLTRSALNAGRELDPTNLPQGDSPPALVALMGACEMKGSGEALVSYVLVSNKGPTDPDPSRPLGSQQALIAYPWFPGHWYDLTLVIPQNRTVDLDVLIKGWLTDEWQRKGADTTVISSAMTYFFPWWCGWGYWWWWWHGSDCIDIGVGEGESIDVEQVAPTRVDMRKWPPVP